VGRRNYLVEGVSGTGKTSVCDELQRRGYQAIHGDRELAYQGGPTTGTEVEGGTHEHHLWRVDKVKALVADHDEAATFFCGGCRNHLDFIALFDGVFVLEVDLNTLGDGSRGDQRTSSAGGRRSASSSSDCTSRKRTPRTVLLLTLPPLSPALSMRFCT